VVIVFLEWNWFIYNHSKYNGLLPLGLKEDLLKGTVKDRVGFTKKLGKNSIIFRGVRPPVSNPQPAGGYGIVSGLSR
jgi:hypothetical protein